jgi:FKBP12-rapamycin complex-associated protein
VQLELSGREEKINEMLDLAQTCNNKELRSRLLQLVGNIRMKKASNYEEFKEVANHFISAAKSYEKIGNIYIILAHSGNDIESASRGVQALGKSIKVKPIKGRLFANQLLGALVNFGTNKKVADAVSVAVQELSPSVLVSTFCTAFSLLLHTSEHIYNVASQICFRLVSSFPQYVGFQLLMMESQHSDIDALEEMYDKLQMEFPVIFSHVSLIYKELRKISETLYQNFQQSLSDSFNAFNEGDKENAFSSLKKFFKMLHDPNKTIHDSQFFAEHTEQLKAIWARISENNSITEDDFKELLAIKGTLQKRFQSLRVIRLSSISPRLEKQQNWDLYLLGNQSLVPGGVKIAKFFHSLGNHEHGIMLTIVGVDGKRYNYQLKKNLKREHPLATEQFVDMLAPIIEEVHRIKHGSIIQLSEKLYLFEEPKGQESMFEMITVYEQSKGRIIDAEQISIHKWAKADYSELDLDTRIAALKNLRKYFEGNELSHAILVTSRDADAWAYRTSHFSSSLGTMSALAFFLGTVNHSPSQLLIDKITGAVTFESFAEVQPNQPVPFRLTPQITNALGRCQYSGPFKTNFIETMKDIRKRATNIAPVLQFTCSEPPYLTPTIPKLYLKQIGVKVDEEISPDSEIDGLYERLYGYGMSHEEELNKLIEEATNITNIAKMPPSWYPWW